jgi:hypothetical protein
MLRAVLRDTVLPAPILDALRQAKSILSSRRRRVPERSFQGVSTVHSIRALETGRFAEVFNRHWALDPYNVPSAGDRVRLRTYNLCSLARLALRSPGDFVIAGVSWGTTPRVLYDLLDWDTLGRTMHLVDPFLAIDNAIDRNKVDKYNSDKGFVERQYPRTARIRFHTAVIPDCLPLEGASQFAFVHLNTSDHLAEARSLHYFYENLGQGGVIVIDDYAIDGGHEDIYDAEIAQLCTSPFVFPTGQAVLFR